MKSVSLKVLGVATATALVALSACSSKPSGSAGSTLRVAAESEPATLDLTSTPAAGIPRILLYNVYEGLVKINAKGRVVPLLAKSFTLSADRKTYTFTLRDNAAFSNGDPLTAADAVYSINRVLAPASTHPFKSQMAVVKSATASDPHTLVVTLKHPSNTWLFSMANPVGIIFDQKAIGAIATTPVGSGPYSFVKWVRGSSLTLKRNDKYWGDKAQVANVDFRFFTDPNAVNSAMLAGDLDIITNSGAPETLKQFEGTDRYTVVQGTSNGEVTMSMNNARGPLKDVRVRQAINYAIDRKALIKTAWAGYGTLIGSMVPPTDPWYVDLANRYPYDPAKAKSLLAAAGYANGFSLQMKLPTRPYAIAAGEFVAAALKKVGINAKVSQLEFPARWVETVLTNGDYDISIINHAEPRDIEKFGDPTYYFHYSNPAVKALLDKADRGTLQQQIVYMKEVAKTLSDDAAADWLFLMPNLEVLAKGVTNYNPNAVSLSYDLTHTSKS